jgi:hypothetical protein
MKEKTTVLVKKYIKIKFDKQFIAKEGAFSYYPGSDHATVEGSAVIGDFADFGMFSTEKNAKLWGNPDKTCANMGAVPVSEISQKDLLASIGSVNVNSIRFYSIEPKNFTNGVLGVFYPKNTSVLDMLELVPAMKKWLNSTSQSMGNWTSKEEVFQRLVRTKISQVPVYKGRIPVEVLNGVLHKNGKIIIIGFDELQTPKYKISYRFQK